MQEKGEIVYKLNFYERTILNFIISGKKYTLSELVRKTELNYSLCQRRISNLVKKGLLNKEKKAHHRTKYYLNPKLESIRITNAESHLRMNIKKIVNIILKNYAKEYNDINVFRQEHYLDMIHRIETRIDALCDNLKIK